MATTVARPGKRQAKIWLAVNPAPPPGGTFNDSGTGTIPLSGTRTETCSFTAAGTGTIPLTGTRTESNSHAVSSATAAGTIPLSGTATEEYLPPIIPGATRSRRPQMGMGK